MELRWRELAKTVERVESGKGVDRDQRQDCVTQFLSGEPAKNLEHLKLIVEIMLEPEHHFLFIAEAFEDSVTGAEAFERLLIRRPATARDELGTQLTEHIQRQSRGDWSLVQDVVPGKEDAREARAAQANRRRLAIGDM